MNNERKYSSIERIRYIYITIMIGIIALCVFIFMQYLKSSNFLNDWESSNWFLWVLIGLWIIILWRRLFFSQKIENKRMSLREESLKNNWIQWEKKKWELVPLFAWFKAFQEWTWFFVKKEKWRHIATITNTKTLSREWYILSYCDIEVNNFENQSKRKNNSLIWVYRTYNATFTKKIHSQKEFLFHELENAYKESNHSATQYISIVWYCVLACGILLWVMTTFPIRIASINTIIIGMTLLCLWIIGYIIVWKKKKKRLLAIKERERQYPIWWIEEKISSLRRKIWLDCKFTLTKNSIIIWIPTESSFTLNSELLISTKTWMKYYQTDEVIREFCDWL